MKKNNIASANVMVNALQGKSARYHVYNETNAELLSPEVSAVIGGCHMDIILDAKHPDQIKLSMDVEGCQVTSSILGLETCTRLSKELDEHNRQNAVANAKAFCKTLREELSETLSWANSEMPNVSALMTSVAMLVTKGDELNDMKSERRSHSRRDAYRRNREEAASNAAVDKEFDEVK